MSAQRPPGSRSERPPKGKTLTGVRPAKANNLSGSLPATSGSDHDHARLVMRCAWLRGSADLLLLQPVDKPVTGDLGLLAANLRDFADLIEVAEREGWWRR